MQTIQTIIAEILSLHTFPIMTISPLSSPFVKMTRQCILIINLFIICLSSISYQKYQRTERPHNELEYRETEAFSMSYFAPYIDGSGMHMPTYEDRLADLVSAYRSIFGIDAELSESVPVK